VLAIILTTLAKRQKEPESRLYALRQAVRLGVSVIGFFIMSASVSVPRSRAERSYTRRASSLGAGVAPGRPAFDPRLRALAWPAREVPSYETLSEHLWNHRDEWFTFLRNYLRTVAPWASYS
jgi:hypothetical protein